jgi:hypothetical protein
MPWAPCALGHAAGATATMFRPRIGTPSVPVDVHSQESSSGGACGTPSGHDPGRCGPLCGLGDVSRYRGKTADLGAYKFDDLAIAETGSSAYRGSESGSSKPGAQVIHKVINSLRVDGFEG